jgi:hypothetical protein
MERDSQRRPAVFEPVYLGWFTIPSNERYEVKFEHDGFDVRGDAILSVVVGHHRFRVPAHVVTAIVASVVK